MSTTSTRDAQPGDGRDETPNERYDRNWNELLQEFRVLQTGTQILAGFLLTLPFQQRFTELNATDHALYVVLVILAATITLFALVPVTVHRLWFRKQAKQQLVALSSAILTGCLAGASLLFVGIVVFILAFVVSSDASLIACVVGLILVATIWAVVPLAVRSRGKHDKPGEVGTERAA